jgi:putative cofactor-binding repeat protein
MTPGGKRRLFGRVAPLGAVVVVLVAVIVVAMSGGGGGHRRTGVRGGGPVALSGGRTYYVSPTGSDAAPGTSPDHAWRSVARVDHAQLRPGDAVLFQGGARFGGAQLTPPASGAPRRPIVFGSYGSGLATILAGAYVVADHLRFERLGFRATFYGGSEVHGTSSDIQLDRLTIKLPAGNHRLGLYSNGDNWVIRNSTVENTGLSGMLLNGHRYRVTGNLIEWTGLDMTNGYNNHGIYLDASDATITGNVIRYFAESGISVRYRGSTITGNLIENGNIGIDFFQTDRHAAASEWSGNRIVGTTAAGIYVSDRGSGGTTREQITIARNLIRAAAGVEFDLARSAAGYVVAANRFSSACCR